MVGISPKTRYAPCTFEMRYTLQHAYMRPQVAQFVAPKPDSTKAVMTWLTSKGITPSGQSDSGDTLDVELPIARANDLLSANFTPYVHDATNTTMTRTLAYSLPAHLHEHIAFVYPTTQYESSARPLSRSAAEHLPGSRLRLLM